MLTLAQLLERRDTLDRHCRTLAAGLDDIRTVTTVVDLEVSQLMKDPIYRTMDKDQYDRIRKNLQDDRLAGLRVWAGVPLYACTRLAPTLDADLRSFTRAARRAPGSVDVFLAPTGGSPLKLSDETTLLLSLLDETRQARYARELDRLPPSQIHALYTEALTAHTPEAGSLIAYIESGRAGRLVGDEVRANPQEQMAAKQLGQHIELVQEERIPSEVATVEDVLQDAGALINRATSLDEGSRLFRLEAIDLERDVRPDVRALYRREAGRREAA